MNGHTSGPDAAGVAVAVELWLIDARAPESAPGTAVGLLDDGERERAERFVHAPDRLLYQVAHVTLRQVMGAHLGVEPAALAFERESCPCCGALHGRPRVAAASVPAGRALPHFNLSHGGDLVMLGLAAVPIGVDVELTASAGTVGEVRGMLHPAEQQELAAERTLTEGEAFSRIWTRKEAYLKGLGTGLGRDLAEDYLGTTGAAPGPSGWTVLDIPAGPRHAAAFAVEAPTARYTLRHSVPA
ncbi:4'-phosphopantetheinyl transferase family protein [Streptacidiphilus fuscans]|uniref:4'-phosphopantetheinyl transferase superfamily protein n=1 Tax=Streptacidiphilus fuscans TaxID=2789292 RepID=A0A931FEA8_9ACTN|nr:4'-phosphopantetheinyl transferase superfamily protein [Streptacidiphilus fuscans]MBF9070458.1 4'-phosphopantetheinyl transferase superfamily protein [Streptacidiphilus fuscans]